MADDNQLTPEKHKEQIEKYAKELPSNITYAATLKRVLENACKVSFPEAFVQSRAKAPSSFAEKVARKFGKYKNAVEDMTDLCGGRVIVQTTEQVLAVRQFIEANFTIVEADDKTELLSEATFGYRDMHYIVQLRPDRHEALGISDEESKTIGDRKAEIQVRTWVQHAWADTLHDRIYKNPLTISSDIRRTGALLSALLEESDRTFKWMADELDGLIANYSAIAKKKDVEKEMNVQQLLLANEPNPRKKPILAMKLAKLALAYGDDFCVVETLKDHADIDDANRCELISDLGYALCRLHRASPASSEYSHGVELLTESLEICKCEDTPYVPHLRKRESLHARALARLGWALEGISGKEHEARDFFQQAHEHEPANPYYLANMLGAEIYYSHQGALPDSMRTTIREAIKTCRDHAVGGIELPAAFFTAGRLNVLLGNTNEALGYYARGIRHYLAGIHCVPDDALEAERQWLTRLHFGEKIPPGTQCVIDLLDLGTRAKADVQPPSGKSSGDELQITSPVLIIAGGAKSIETEETEPIRSLLATSLNAHRGTVISGGTNVGIPGYVGDVAGDLAAENQKQFNLIGYVPDRLPHGVLYHGNYDQMAHEGDDFSACQVLRYWTDILAKGVKATDVMLLGIGGGPLSHVEYCVAMGLGASVGIVMNTGGTADQLLKDDLWSDLPNLYPLPFDATTVRAFVIPPQREFTDGVEDKMAKSFHKVFVSGSTNRLPANMRPWKNLDDTFKTANQQQAKYAVTILEAAGFEVHEAQGDPKILDDFTDDEVEHMAEMEHGRWNVERLRNGWRYGKPRDDASKIHDCLVSWEDLDDDIKHYDQAAVRAFPKILAQAGLEVVRKE